jgi:hypothetical protein
VIPLLLWALIGCMCQSDPYPAPIPGTAYRITDDVPEKDSEVFVDLLTTWRECAGAGVSDMEACVPRADRASGEVQLGFQIKDPQTSVTLFRSITPDQIRVTHDRATQSAVELIPHEPVSSGQLFILLIDGSGSMYENDSERIKKVYQALMMPKVIKGFFPEDGGKTGVVLLRFSNKVTGLDGGPPRVVKNAADYKRMVQDHLLETSGGFTHLYDAVEYSVTELLQTQAVSGFLTVQAAEPTLVVLTDGFNNEEASDTCATNAPRLQEALDVVREARTTGSAQSRPTVYTVGLGKAIAGVKKPKSKNIKVTPRGLCGPYADRRIDSDLEDYGIDGVSLEWIAEAGGGITFVKRNPQGLAEVFQRAARPRYRWYELRYRVPDSLYHRKSFDIEVQLTSADLAVTTVKMLPSPWVDAPTGHKDDPDDDAQWVEPTPFRASVAVMLPIFSVLIILTYLGPAWFNARRGITRRAKLRR